MTGTLFDAFTLDAWEEETDTVDVDDLGIEATPVRATLDKSGLHLDDPALIEKAERTKVSNSLIDGMFQCPAKQAADKWLLPDVIPMDPLSPTALGSAFHKVMEVFFGFPPVERTEEGIKRAYRAMLEDDEFKALRDSPESRKWVRHRVIEYLKMGFENPKDVRIAQVEKVGRNGRKYLKPGLELFVSGTIGDSSRDTLGFIDRLSVNGDGEYIVDDWKTGAKVKLYDPDDRFPHFGYVRQQILYTMMLEQSGDRKVAEARLIYPDSLHPTPDGGQAEGGYVDVIPIHNKAYRARAVKDVETCSALLDDSCSLNQWATKPGALCSWCPLVNACPVAYKMSKANAVESRTKQPTQGFLRTKAGINVIDS